MTTQAPSPEEMEAVKELLQKQVDMMMSAMKQVEAQVGANIDQMDQRLNELSERVANLQKVQSNTQ